ncbi:bifunctional DNA primase/polymerase [Actinopolymorpha sp. B9G3]|uniref:bifunctional DNA primase/polymerase n=1 Tax=Actinopolymorpha sp. B9G3 TaxID=3158970 RepID=UPI0032D8D81C
MSEPRCRRCRGRLTPIYPGQTEHPTCSPTPTGWIPKVTAQQVTLDLSDAKGGPVRLALELAGLGWHVFPLSPVSKRPLGNCRTCRTIARGTPHPAEECPCLPAGKWCHGVRAATTNPTIITGWWHDEPHAVPGIAAGPSDRVLIDIDTHGDPLPDDLATGLLPGINLAAEPIDEHQWRDPGRYRDGRDTLRLLAQIRGGTHPWPGDPGHQPVSVATPSGGRHLWYRAPVKGLRQALSNHGLGWQIDVKAGWSYGVAPGATTTAGKYEVVTGDIANPGRLPAWLAREVSRVTTPRPPRPVRPVPPPQPGLSSSGRGPAAYLTTVINRGTNRLTGMRDGRKRALAALAYHAGGLLDWSGLDEADVTNQLVAAGTASGLSANQAHRITHRALARGIATPLPAPTSSRRSPPIRSQEVASE